MKATIGGLLFLGVTALEGGIEMLLYPRGNEFLPGELMDSVPLLDAFVIPGLVLALVLGIGSLFVAWGVASRRESRPPERLEDWSNRHWSWAGTLLTGASFASWMIVEIALLGAPWNTANTSEAITTSVLYGIYVTVAVSLLALPWHGSVRADVDLDSRSNQARNQAASS